MQGDVYSPRAGRRFFSFYGEMFLLPVRTWIKSQIPSVPKTTMEATEERYTKDGTTDIHGRPAVRKDTGNWRACPYILGIILKSPPNRHTEE
ncbi:hypothetical protein B296_00054303 [Ensete ventricosum]|uniref:Uncharacterized protein n=1 Tax=Ensete ventricosum TaxID=4639 RepID=A0A426WYX0_ENSVE|nr:hypothetical protein B296_00054303 [Ensete ventricosum]